MHDTAICITPGYIAESIILDYISDIDKPAFCKRSVKDQIEQNMRIYAAKSCLNKIRDNADEDPVKIILKEKIILVDLCRHKLKAKCSNTLECCADTVDTLLEIVSDALNERKIFI